MNRFPVAILAGGLATRLGTLTRQVPKSLIEVSGRPFIYHQLRQLRDQGIRRVVLCLGYLGEQVVDCVGNGSAFSLEVVYSFDGPDLRGTGAQSGGHCRFWVKPSSSFTATLILIVTTELFRRRIWPRESLLL